MKKICTILALIAAAVSLAACHDKATNGEMTMGRDIYYTVAEDPVMAVFGGEGTSVHLNTEAEWDTLLDRFCRYAEQGGQVMFCGSHRATAQGPSSKAPSSIVTADREKLKGWMKEMEKAGRTVVVTYDEGNGTWSGVSYANLGPQDEEAAEQTLTGSIAMADIPALADMPQSGAVLALRTADGSTYIVTMQGMMFWVENPEDCLLPEDLQLTMTGVASSFTDQDGESFTTLEVSEIDADVILMPT